MKWTLVLLLGFAVWGLGFAGCGVGRESPAKEAERGKQPQEQSAAAPETKQADEAAPVKDMKEEQSMTNKHPVVLMKTSKGDIKIELDAEKAPITVANFLKYVKSKHYDGTIFHRVIGNFMIQGGGYTEDLYNNPGMSTKATGKPIQNEAANGLKNVRGTIAMARTPDPNSATAQFFINVKDNSSLDYKGPQNFGYCVFGKVIEGMDVVDAIRNVKTEVKGHHENLPVEPVKIISVTEVGE